MLREFFVKIAFADPLPSDPTPAINNPLKNVNSIPELIRALLDVAVEIGLPLLVLALVYVGYKFVHAQGSETELKEAKQALLWTVVGAAVVLGARVISYAIEATVTNLG